ncbi:hypothetical protein [Thermococcus stetteri]|uniref:hypothetical protein n=1 Tax=Thermococcus stetteri TaxID=49900 RepID=UPI001FD7EA69|nr:hypothetical protein [Thermococcus stetteri]MBP1912954.1 hypothetical protein [Thermococcus stetteri]
MPEVVALYGKPGIHILKMVLVLPYLLGTAYYTRKSVRAQAIYITPKKENGQEVHVNYKRCTVVFSRTLSCSVCIKEYPFTKGSYEKVKRVYEKVTEKEKASKTPN